MKATSLEVPTKCPSCGADQMSCDVKLGLGGRACCESCSGHDPKEATR